MINDSANQTREKFNALINLLGDDDTAIPVACFGEIDIRVNISRIVLKSRSFDSINLLAIQYLDQLNRIPAETIIIWGPGPSMTNLSQEDINTEWPSFGTEFTRNALIHLFNKAILSKINDYPKLKFATLFYDLIGKDMYAKQGSLLDGLHINNSAYPVAIRMIQELAGSESKAIFNNEIFTHINRYEFSVVENAFPSIQYIYQLYKFYEPIEYEIFLIAFDNPFLLKLSTIEIQAKNLNPEKIYDSLNEVEFIKIYFSKPTFECVKKYVDYVEPRLKKNNATMFDVTTKEGKFNKEFAIHHFYNLCSQLKSEENKAELHSLLNRLWHLRSSDEASEV
jgi:hypothetical protein